jgi:acyl-ACP thioesterase
MPISKDFTSILTLDWEINFLQCYPNGYLKYTELCNILQLTAAVHAEKGGISFTDMQLHHQAWVLSKIRVEIKRLPKWKDTVIIKTWINSLENSRSVRCLEMYIGEEKIVGCETFWVVMNTISRRPEELVLPHKHFEKYEERATIQSFGKIDFQDNLKIISNHKVKLSDLDIVNHANSVKYLEWCLDKIAFESIKNQKIKSFEMNYLKEVSLDEEVKIKQHLEDKKIIFAVQREEKICFALLIHLK